jgi:polyferredoxin
MKSPRLGRNAVLLLVMLLLGGLYSGWFYFQGTLTGASGPDGVIGVLLGLYMASHPAGNMLDMLLFMGGDVRENILKTASGRVWLALNALVVLAAWLVIFIGVMLFVRKTG